MDEKDAAMQAVNKTPTQTFRLLCEVVVEANGDINTEILYDLNQKLAGTTWERLGDKCFRACEKIMNEHFGPCAEEREKDVA